MAGGFTITTDEPLTDEQRQKIQEAGSNPDNLSHLTRSRPADLTEPLTMMGGQYRLCEDVYLPPVNLGSVYALAMIGSPFVTDAPEATPTDIMNAVYVLANGQAAIQTSAFRCHRTSWLCSSWVQALDHRTFQD